MKKGLLKNILKTATTFTVTASVTLSSLLMLNYKKLDGDLIGNQKYMDKVEEELGANMKIMELLAQNVTFSEGKIIRLVPNSSKKIHINIGDEISDRVKGHIRQVISEMNEVFDFINDDYNFVECSKEEFDKYRSGGETSISFNYTDIEREETHGITKSEIKNKTSLWDKDDSFYIVGASVYFDDSRFDELSDTSQLTIIKHEFLHTLGFGDIYQGYKDETSMINIGIVGLSTHLSPNDLKMLYVAYGTYHLNKFGFYDQGKMDKAKALIDEYEVKYYATLMNALSGGMKGNFQTITNEDLKEQVFEKDGLKITIKDGKYSYIDKYGVPQSGKLIVGENYVVLSDVQIPQSVSFVPLKEPVYQENLYKNDFLVLLKDENGLNIYNFDISHMKSENAEDDFLRELEISMR